MEKFGGFRALKSIAKSLHYQPKKIKGEINFFVSFFPSKIVPKSSFIILNSITVRKTDDSQKIDGINVLWIQFFDISRDKKLFLNYVLEFGKILINQFQPLPYQIQV